MLGKRLAQKRVHYPKSKKTAPALSTTAPPPTSTARPMPSASSKLHTNLPPPPTVQTPSTSRIIKVPPTEPEYEPSLPSEDDDEAPLGSPTPLPTSIASIAMGSSTPTLLPLASWTPAEVDAVMAFASHNTWRNFDSTTDPIIQRAFAVRLVKQGQIPHPSSISSGPASEAHHGLQTAHCCKGTYLMSESTWDLVHVLALLYFT